MHPTQWISQRVWTEVMDRLHEEALALNQAKDDEDAYMALEEARWLCASREDVFGGEGEAVYGLSYVGGAR